MAALSLQVLGVFVLTVEGVAVANPSTKKARALLTYLALNRDLNLARERLIERFWPDADAVQGRDNLKTALWSVRRSLRLAKLDPESYIVADRSIVKWVGEIEVDAQRFMELVSLENAIADAQAIALYRGDFLEGDYDNWAQDERERLATSYETVLSRSVRNSKDLASASRLLERNPYEEPAYVTLIEGELKRNRLHAAVIYAERCRASLAEVGDKPSSDFEARFAALHVKDENAGEAVLPFSGRRAELALIENLCDCAHQGEGSLLFVHGDAGIGKSSLAHRAIHIGASRGLSAKTIHCLMDDSRPLGPWQGTFTVETPVDSIASAIAQSAIPAMLIIEDAHALTGDAFNLTLDIVRKSRERIIIITSRPEGVQNVRDGLRGLEYRETRLQPLARAELERALLAATGIQEPQLLDALWNRTSGHPYFASSLFTALVQRGFLVCDRRRWRIAKPLTSAIELPASLKRYIEVRLQSRGEHAPVVAAALGLDSAATADDLVAVLGVNEALVLDALDDLLALGLIVESSESSSFSFAHDLIREVAVAMVNLGRRTSLHRAFAVHLDAQFGENISLRRARHLRASGQTLQSVEDYMRAATDALAWNALNNARELLEEARMPIERMAQSSARDLALAKLDAFTARLHLAEGDSEGALKFATDAAALARSAGSEIELARAFLTQAYISGVAFEPSAQRRYADDALAVAERRGARDIQAAALVQRSQAMRLMAQPSDSLDASQAAYDMASSCNDWGSANRAIEERLRAELTWWRFPEAKATADRAFDGSSQMEMLGHASLLQTRAALWYLLERYDAAQQDLDDAANSMGQVDRRQTLLGDPRDSLIVMRFANDTLDTCLALRQSIHDASAAAIKRMQASPLCHIDAFARLIALLHIDVLLARDGPGDMQHAGELTAKLLTVLPVAQSYLGWSVCPELANARVSARLRRPNASGALRRALNAVEEHARNTPLTADMAFDQLAAAAFETGEEAVAVRAQSRAHAFRSVRLAAADATAFV